MRTEVRKTTGWNTVERNATREKQLNATEKNNSTRRHHLLRSPSFSHSLFFLSSSSSLPRYPTHSSSLICPVLSLFQSLLYSYILPSFQLMKNAGI